MWNFVAKVHPASPHIPPPFLCCRRIPPRFVFYKTKICLTVLCLQVFLELFTFCSTFILESKYYTIPKTISTWALFIVCCFIAGFFILFNGILNSFDYGKGVVRDRRTVLSNKIVVFVVCNLYSFTVVIHWFAYLFTPFPLILCTNCLDTGERRRVRHCGRRPSVVKGYYNYYNYIIIIIIMILLLLFIEGL